MVSLNHRIAFVTTFCPHYRKKTFQMLSERANVDFYFFSGGQEWYWLPQHELQEGGFKSVYLPGFRIGRTRVIPTLPWHLFRKDYDVYIKCINGRIALPLTLAVARLRKRPFILWTGVWTRLQTPTHRMFYPVTRWIYRNADAIVVYGEHVRNFLIEEGVLPERIFVAPHAIDNPKYAEIVHEDEKLEIRRSLGIDSDQHVVLYFGRLVEDKGIAFLISAFSRIARSDAVLVIAGDGPDRAKLEELVRDAGLAGRVRFSGYVRADHAVRFYAIAAALVVPSITTSVFKEPWGLVVNEALCQGLPVIVTDSVGAAAGGLVVDGKNGLVVPERDSQALARAIAQILDDSQFRNTLSVNALATISEWTNEAMVEGFQQAITFVRRVHRG